MSIEVGDTIKIIDPGFSYPCYDLWAQTYGLDKFISFSTYVLGIDSCESDLVGRTGKVVCVAPNLSRPNETLYGVLIIDQHFIFDKDGIELFAKRREDRREASCQKNCALCKHMGLLSLFCNFHSAFVETTNCCDDFESP